MVQWNTVGFLVAFDSNSPFSTKKNQWLCAKTSGVSFDSQLGGVPKNLQGGPVADRYTFSDMGSSYKWALFY